MRADARDSAGDFEETRGITPDWLFNRFFGRVPTESETDICRVFLERFDHDVVENAFFRACQTDNKNIAYVQGIIKNYQARGVKDIGDVAADDMCHDASKNRRGGHTARTGSVKMPDTQKLTDPEAVGSDGN